MWRTIARLWGSIGLLLETTDSAVRTVNNLVTTAEEHSDHFKSVSLAELQAKQAEVLAATSSRIATAQATTSATAN